MPEWPPAPRDPAAGERLVALCLPSFAAPGSGFELAVDTTGSARIHRSASGVIAFAVPPALLNRLARAIRDARFFELPARHAAFATDVTYLRIGVAEHGATKTVEAGVYGDGAVTASADEGERLETLWSAIEAIVEAAPPG